MTSKTQRRLVRAILKKVGPLVAEAVVEDHFQGQPWYETEKERAALRGHIEDAFEALDPRALADGLFQEAKIRKKKTTGSMRIETGVCPDPDNPVHAFVEGNPIPVKAPRLVEVRRAFWKKRPAFVATSDPQEKRALYRAVHGEIREANRRLAKHGLRLPYRVQSQKGDLRLFLIASDSFPTGK